MLRKDLQSDYWDGVLNREMCKTSDVQRKKKQEQKEMNCANRKLSGSGTGKRRTSISEYWKQIQLSGIKWKKRSSEFTSDYYWVNWIERWRVLEGNF